MQIVSSDNGHRRCSLPPIPARAHCTGVACLWHCFPSFIQLHCNRCFGGPALTAQAFDDTELSGSADDLLLGGPFQALSPYLFAVRFSRDCTGEWAVGQANASGIIT